MKRNLLPIFLCLALLLNVFGCAPSPIADESTGPQSSEGTEVQSTEEETTVPSSEEEMLAKAIWQDPNNVVLLWSSSFNYEYSIYRSNNSNNGFKYVGRSITGSYRDATAKYPNEYYYIIKAKNLKNRVSSYFRTDANHSAKTRVLIRKIADIKLVVVNNETEALLLECNLIKLL